MAMSILFGAMNHPDRNPIDEVISIANDGFDFCDFTHETKGQIGTSTAEEIKRIIHDEKGFKDFQFVGHTAYYIPIAIEFPRIINAGVEQFKESIAVMLNLDIHKATIHYDWGKGFMSKAERIRCHQYAMGQLTKIFPYRTWQTDIILENTPVGENQAAEFKEVLAEVPELGLHLDIAHALITGGMKEVEAFLELGLNGRLKHIHISDNNGKADDHLPVQVPHKTKHPWPEIMKMVKQCGYGTTDRNNTVTLEIHSDDHWNRVHSRDIIRELWEKA